MQGNGLMLKQVKFWAVFLGSAYSSVVFGRIVISIFGESVWHSLQENRYQLTFKVKVHNILL